MLPKNLQTISGGAPKFPKRISGNPRRETLEYPTFFQDLGCLKFGCIRTMRAEGAGSRRQFLATRRFELGPPELGAVKFALSKMHQHCR
jgi:hypothetical protein